MSKPVFALAARSAIGLRRSGNEDSAITSANLIAVADGMGGHAGGEVASAIAIKELTKLIPISQSIHIDADSIEDLLAQAMVDIDLEIARVANDDPELRGMGTTLTALLLHEDRIALMHIGDSRASLMSWLAWPLSSSLVIPLISSSARSYGLTIIYFAVPAPVARSSDAPTSAGFGTLAPPYLTQRAQTGESSCTRHAGQAQNPCELT